ASVLVVGNPQEDDPGGRVFTRLCELTCCGTLDGAAATFPARLLSDENDSATLLDVRVPPPALTSAVLDDLAMTSKYPKTGARPDISRWLHGSIEEAEMYVELAWRAELDWITEPEGAARLLDAFPISARETARCPLYEAVEVLAAIRARCLDDSVMASKLVIVTRYGVTEGRPLGSVAEEELRQFLRNTLVVLPGSAGGYDGHFVDPNAGDSVVDVAEEAQPPSRARRRRLWVKSGSVSMVTTK